MWRTENSLWRWVCIWQDRLVREAAEIQRVEKETDRARQVCMTRRGNRAWIYGSVSQAKLDRLEKDADRQRREEEERQLKEEKQPQSSSESESYGSTL